MSTLLTGGLGGQQGAVQVSIRRQEEVSEGAAALCTAMATPRTWPCPAPPDASPPREPGHLGQSWTPGHRSHYQNLPDTGQGTGIAGLLGGSDREVSQSWGWNQREAKTREEGTIRDHSTNWAGSCWGGQGQRHRPGICRPTGPSAGSMLLSRNCSPFLTKGSTFVFFSAKWTKSPHGMCLGLTGSQENPMRSPSRAGPSAGRTAGSSELACSLSHAGAGV